MENEVQGAGKRSIWILISLAILIGGALLYAKHRREGEEQVIKIVPVDGSPILSQVRGTVLVPGNGTVLINNEQGTFALEGDLKKDIALLKGRTVSVFGKMRVPNPSSINGVPIKYSIAVSTYSAGELAVGQPLPPAGTADKSK